jgi:hypothetical protein
VFYRKIILEKESHNTTKMRGQHMIEATYHSRLESGDLRSFGGTTIQANCLYITS